MVKQELMRLLDSRTPKIYRGGSARSRSPEETWSRIAPLLDPCGITRVANITGLDHVGIPVYQAIRPNSRSLSVSQGKGSEPIAAKVSAVMEAIELFFAERPRCPLRRATLAELEREGPVADPQTLPHTTDYDARRPILWTQGVDIVSGREIWVPFDLVHVNLTEAAGSSLLVTSNGLASGNNLAEAVFHGLCEVIERDAAALFALRPNAVHEALLDVDRVEHAGVRALRERLRAADLTPVAWNMTTDIGLPAVRVYLFDTRADAALNPISAPYGAGCHIDGATALIRALTESAQTRVGWIAGSRDDLSRDAYRFAQAASLDLAEFVSVGKSSRLEDLPACDSPTIEEDLAYVLDALKAVGIAQVIVVPLSDANLPVAIARVIVPGLEGPSEADTKPGKRGMALSR
jgi:YcaO-like protein with predicted kinase domain